jgi:hypothetical protein
MAGLLMLCLVSFVPLRGLSQATAPFVQLKSYTGSFPVSGSSTNTWFYGDGTVWVIDESNFNYTNTVTWIRTAGGTNFYGGKWHGYHIDESGSWWEDGTTETTTIWPPWPGAGVTSWLETRSGSFTNWTDSGSTNDVPNTDYWRWEHLQWEYHCEEFSDPNDPWFTSSYTYTWKAIADAQIELWTGGEPGSSNLVDITLQVTATDADTNQNIDYSQITLLGMTPDADGYVTITTNENLFIGCTPTVSTNHTNYSFYVWVVHPPDCGCSNCAEAADLKIKMGGVI